MLVYLYGVLIMLLTMVYVLEKFLKPVNHFVNIEEFFRFICLIKGHNTPPKPHLSIITLISYSEQNIDISGRVNLTYGEYKRRDITYQPN